MKLMALMHLSRRASSTHRARQILLVCALVLVAAWSPVRSADGAPFAVKVHGVSVNGNQVTVAFEVRDPAGGESPNLEAPNVEIVELQNNNKTPGDQNNTPGDPIQLEQDQLCGQHTNARNSILVPTTACDGTPLELLSSNGKPIEVVAPSATIGVVFDVVALDDVPAGEPDTTFDAWMIVKKFLCASESGNQCAQARTKGKAPLLEGIGLFIPPSKDSAQIARRPDFVDFPQDQAIRSELLAQLSPNTIVRKGPTKLFETILEAMQATAKTAKERGGPAIVLVVSNSTDETYPADAIKAIESFISEPNDTKAGKVTIVAFRASKNEKLDPLLDVLAKKTGGVFVPIQYKEDEPTWKEGFDTIVSNTFTDIVQTAPTSLYIAQYRTELISDGQEKALKVQIKRDDGTIVSESKVFKFKIDGQKIPPNTLDEAWSAAVRSYFLLAIPITLLISVLIVLLTGAARWNRGRSSGISR